MTTIGATPETITQSRYAKYYHEVVKPDEQRLKQERERIRTYGKEKYQNDEVYKEYKREPALKIIIRRKMPLLLYKLFKILNLNGFFSIFLGENEK
jgi:hypothetical protein